MLLPAVAAVATVATTLLLPCRPTAFDLAAMPATVALARAAHKPTACPPRAPDVAEAAAALATHGVPVAPVRLGERRGRERASAAGVVAAVCGAGGAAGGASGRGHAGEKAV